MFDAYRRSEAIKYAALRTDLQVTRKFTAGTGGYNAIGEYSVIGKDGIMVRNKVSIRFVNHGRLFFCKHQLHTAKSLLRSIPPPLHYRAIPQTTVPKQPFELSLEGEPIFDER